MVYNEYNQPIGDIINDFEMPGFPDTKSLKGQYSRLEKLSTQHIDDLFNHFSVEADAPNWTYLPDEQTQDFNQFKAYINNKIKSKDPYFFSIIDNKTEEAVGILSLLRINQKNASIEVGHIHYSNVLKQSRIATEVQYLLAKYVFETLGYRRYEWKCDALNQPSIKAAKRLGFKYEGIFRNHTIYKNRSRDTCWLSMIDSEWYENKIEFEKWLNPYNFDEFGIQLTRVSMN
ncbi:GNAT family N-acetyltransferase [Staphylococcus equorum]